MPPLYVSYFTAGTEYESEARELAATLHRFGLDRHVASVPNLGKWELNCARKPSFLMEMRVKYPTRALVWLDADARVKRKPVLFDTLNCDVAYHLFGGTQLASGTLYFGPTREADDCLAAWSAECAAHPETWDQQALQNVVERMGRYLRTAELPEAYLAIDGLGTCSKEDAIVWHTQASRRLKHRV